MTGHRFRPFCRLRRVCPLAAAAAFLSLPVYAAADPPAAPASSDAPAEAAPAKKVEPAKVRVELHGLKGDDFLSRKVLSSVTATARQESAVRDNILGSLSIEQAVGDKHLTEARVHRLHQQAPGEIANSLQPFGYYRPNVQSALTEEKGVWVASYTIDPGPQMKVTAVDVSVDGAGKDEEEFQRAVRNFPLHPGDVLNHPTYEGGKAPFEQHAAENGYLDGTWKTSEIRVDLAAYQAQIVLHYDTGKQYLFGPVTFHQNILKDGLLKGYVTFKQGEPLDATKLLAMQNALSNSPYFQRVEVLTEKENAQGLEVPIVVELTPAKRQRYTAGVGYGSDTGARGSAGLEVRRLNDLGHRADIEAKVSEIERNFQASYIIPGSYPSTDLLTFSVGYDYLHPDTSTSETELAGVSLSRALGRWRQAFGLNYQRENFVVGLDNGISELLIPNATWSRVFADDRIFPNHGERYQFTIRGADDSVLSNATFVQVDAQAKVINTFAPRFRFIARAEVGSTWTNDFHALPPSIRFFAGGDQSVRGYAYQALGGRDAAGNVIGGKDLLTASTEVEYRFLQKWGVAAFVDAGNAADTLGATVKVGTGVGLRWLSPIGMVRLDVATAVSDPGHPIRFHLNLGPDL